MFKASMLLIIMTFVVGCSATRSASDHAPSPFVPTPVSSDVNFEGMGPLELQSALMNYSDRANSRIAEAAVIIEAIGTPRARVKAGAMLVGGMSANAEMAAGPYPGLALLDMLVVASLRRIVWEEYWEPVLGEAVAPAIALFRKNEADIWSIAGKLLTREQLDNLAQLVLDWRKANPEQVAVSYIRFNDFSGLGLKPAMKKLTAPGGLFASVEEVARVAQDVRNSIDRAFFLMSRFQLLLSYQIKYAYLDIIFEPEAEGLADVAKKTTRLAERYAEVAEKLPKQFSDEAADLLILLFAELQKSREGTIAHVEQVIGALEDDAISDLTKAIATERKATIDHAMSGLAERQDAMHEQLLALLRQGMDDVNETADRIFLLSVLYTFIFFIILSLFWVFVVKRRPTRKQ